MAAGTPWRQWSFCKAILIAYNESMPETYSTQAIVLSRRPAQGVNNKVSLYTLDRGKVNLMVKGARRPTSRLSAHLEPMTLVDLMVISGQAYDFAGGASSRNCHSRLKVDFDKITAAGRGIYYLNRLLKENIKDENIFFLTRDFLSILDTHMAEAVWYEWMTNIFLYKVLDQMGYGLEADGKHALPRREQSLKDISASSISRSEIVKTNAFLEKWIRRISEF